MKREITKLDVGSVAMVYGALLAVIALVFMLLIFAFGSMFATLFNSDDNNLGALLGGGVAMVVLIPVLYGAFGAFFGAIFAVIYNLVTPYTGGIKVFIRDAQS